MELNKAYIPGGGPDALDALFCFGWRIVKELPKSTDCNTLITGPSYRLCAARADPNFGPSIGLLLREMSEAEDYYAWRLIQERRKIK